jgi:hypothetical protein
MYIKPKIVLILNNNEKEDFFCSICKFCLITGKDHEYHKTYKACEECYYTFIESQKELWDKDKKLVDKNKLKEYIYLRKKLTNIKIELK